MSSGFLEYVLEQLAAIESLRARRMFSGAGLYSGDVFFGLISGDALFFKVDDSTRGDYLARGMAPFRPYHDRPELSFSYFEVPAEALEDREECELWARRAIEVAARAPSRGVPRRAARRPRGTARP